MTDDKAWQANQGNRGRLAGLTVVIIATLFSAFTLVQEKASLAEDKDIPISTSESSAGFNPQFWYLPDEPLLGFVEIPAGEFLMGSDPAIDKNAYENERWSNRSRRGRVSVATFYISRFETTVAQYKIFVQTTHHPVAGNVLSGDGNLPITGVTLPDALAYCRWLEIQLKNNENISEELSDKLSQGWRVTLPTEAQWEKAARGRNGKIYPWGNQATTTFANFRSDHLRPVGSKACDSCEYELADMSGNAWEMTRSFYLPYPFDGGVLPDTDSDALFVMRGGSYTDNDVNVRAAVRGGVDPGARNDAIGFRIVMSPPKH